MPRASWPFSVPTRPWKNGFAGWRSWPIEGNFDRIRSTAITIVQEVDEGGFLDESIENHFSRLSFSDQQKALAYEISSGVIRHKAYLDWFLARFLTRQPKKEVRYLLWVALFQVLFMKKASYHVVNETVEYAKKREGKGIGRLVNAVLRRALTETGSPPLPAEPLSRLSVQYSFPAWMVDRWLSRFGSEDTENLLALLDREPEFCLRIDLNRTTRDAVSSHFREKGLETREGVLLSSALYVNRLGPVLADRLLAEGLVQVQDESSQLVSITAGIEPGMLVLDAAAEPGTKTSHLLQLYPSAKLVAMDLHVNKLRSLSSRVLLVRGDAVRNPFKKESFDSILLDAPCSSLGVIRKHPEIKWRRRESDIVWFSRYQSKMIDALWECLKPGGHFIYSVCSFEPEETTDVIDRLREEKRFSLATPLPFSSDDGFYVSLPQRTGSDGFFIAKLTKER